MVFRFRSGFHSRGMDAQVVGEELEKVQLAAGGLLRPDDVIAVAEDKDSPLHDAFEWNNKTAAGEYRRVQARSLIRSMIVIEDDRPATPRFVHVNLKDDVEEEKTQSAYLTLDSALADERYRAQILDEAKHQLITFRKKYQALRELSAVITAIDELVPEPEAVAV